MKKKRKKDKVNKGGEGEKKEEGNKKQIKGGNWVRSMNGKEKWRKKRYEYEKNKKRGEKRGEKEWDRMRHKIEKE